MNEGKDPLVLLAARRLQKIADGEISEELRSKTILALLDYLGAIACGLQAPWASKAIQYARRQRGLLEAHVWGLQEDACIKTAAFVNALLAHSAIRDDMHLASNSHIGSIVISAALALAQRDGWSGDQLIRAIIGGYEMATLLGTAVQQSPGYNKHARPSGICGAFGAAGAAAVGNNASEDTAVNTLAFAANMASGFNEWAWAGGVEIYTEMGSASQAGIDAFELAAAGLECSASLLEGKAGLFAGLNASKGENIFRTMLQERDVGSGILEVRFKPAPGCNYIQTILAVAERLVQRHDLSQGIKSVHVECTSGAKNYPGCDNHGPFSNVQQTKMSIQFGVCAVLLHGNVSEELFTRYGSKEITELASNCSVEAVNGFEAAFQARRQPARVKVTLTNGSVVAEELEDVPWLDPGAVHARFRHETSGSLGSERSDKVLSMLERLAELKDCKDLTGLFKP